MNAPVPIAASLLLLTVLAMPVSAAPSSNTIPCGDPRGCPDLVVDDLHLAAGAQTIEPWFAEDCAVQEGATEEGLRQLLRFTFSSPNLGDGDLIVGAPSDRPRLFEYHACHDHLHFKEYADYRLWEPAKFLEWDAYRIANPGVTAQKALANNPAIATGLITGEKRGFCVIDIAPAGPTKNGSPVVPDPLPKYLDCDDNQGISRGWADTYDPTLDGQWIDVTHVAPGAYILEAEVNAERVYVESSYSNNRAFTAVVVAPGPFNTGLPIEDPLAASGAGVENPLGEVVLPGTLGGVFATLDDALAGL